MRLSIARVCLKILGDALDEEAETVRTSAKIVTAVSLWLGLGSQVSHSQVGPLGEWITRAPLPTPRQEIPNVVLNGKIYVPGGFEIGGVASTVMEVFDPTINAWSSAAPLPRAMHHVASASANGKLYVLGGYDGNTFVATSRVFEYDPQSDTWTDLAAIPTSRGAAVAVEFDGKIFVIGGAFSGIPMGTNEMYDPITDSWTTRAPMPTPREHLAAAVIDSLIYVAGGRQREGFEFLNSNQLEAYSPATDSWFALTKMPTSRGGLAAATLNGRLYVFGGEIPGVFPMNEEYDPTTDSWREMAPMPTPRHGMGAATIADTIFIIGGGPVEGFGVTDVTEGFTVSLITRVAEEGTPRKYTLYQNYPNPFNPTTTIRFTLPSTTEVTLSIHDLLGREIATLVNGNLDSGEHEVVWNAKGISTGGDASGVYFYRLQARSRPRPDVAPTQSGQVGAIRGELSGHQSRESGQLFLIVKKLLLVK